MHQVVKIVGWGSQMEQDEYGVKSNVDYWLVANSKGHNWGDDGFFKVLRGPKSCWQNGCIEMKVSAPNFNFYKRVLYKGPVPHKYVEAGRFPKRPQDFLYVASNPHMVGFE
jgi:C1A family cysteine protease